VSINLSTLVGFNANAVTQEAIEVIVEEKIDEAKLDSPISTLTQEALDTKLTTGIVDMGEL
jgi:hypothetical protein